MAETAAGTDVDTRTRGVAARKAKAERAQRHVWCAYHSDGSVFVLFGTELAAMRYAVENDMKCQAVAFGVGLREQTK